MKIERLSNDNDDRFGNLREGEVFEQNERVFMKIGECKQTENYKIIERNAVDLTTGLLWTFSSENEIKLFNGILVEKQKS